MRNGGEGDSDSSEAHGFSPSVLLKGARRKERIESAAGKSEVRGVVERAEWRGSSRSPLKQGVGDIHGHWERNRKS